MKASIAALALGTSASQRAELPIRATPVHQRDSIEIAFPGKVARVPWSRVVFWRSHGDRARAFELYRSSKSDNEIPILSLDAGLRRRRAQRASTRAREKTSSSGDSF